jgi:hypothetical protein
MMKLIQGGRNVLQQRKSTLDCRQLTLLCDNLKRWKCVQNFFSWHYFGNLLCFSSYPHHSTILHYGLNKTEKSFSSLAASQFCFFRSTTTTLQFWFLQGCVILALQCCVIVVLQGCVILALQCCGIVVLQGCVIVALKVAWLLCCKVAWLLRWRLRDCCVIPMPAARDKKH